MFSSIGLIGAGTMGSAVLQAAAKGAPDAALYCSNRTPAKAQALAQEVGGQAVDNAAVARTCSLCAVFSCKRRTLSKDVELLFTIFW